MWPLDKNGSKADGSSISGLECYGNSVLCTGCAVTDLEVSPEVMFTSRDPYVWAEVGCFTCTTAKGLLLIALTC